jgi:hypothetical protein
LRLFVVSCQEGVTEYCGLLIPVHRSTSEFYGFRQRCVVAQGLESTTQGKTSRLLNTLGTRLWEKPQLQTESLRNSERLCQVGIEQVQGVNRGQNCWTFCEKILCQVGIEIVCRQAQKKREIFELWKLKGESTEGSSQGC